MAVAEALARGVPVISTATGASTPCDRRFRRPGGFPCGTGRAAGGRRRVHCRTRRRSWRRRSARAARARRSHRPQETAAMERRMHSSGGAARSDCAGLRMSSFSADWLALREPADHAARSMALTRAVADALAKVPVPGILDLACGTGSNWRYLIGVFTGPTHPHWLLVDHDADLLARVPASDDVETRCVDLSTLDDPSIFADRRSSPLRRCSISCRTSGCARWRRDARRPVRSRCLRSATTAGSSVLRRIPTTPSSSRW